MVRQIVIVLLNIGAIITAGNLAGCSHTGPSELEKVQSMPERTIEQVQEEHTDAWMDIPGVEGTAIGLSEGKPCIKIYVMEKTPELEQKIPKVLEGYPVVVEQTGEIRALPKKQD